MKTKMKNLKYLFTILFIFSLQTTWAELTEITPTNEYSQCVGEWIEINTYSSETGYWVSNWVITNGTYRTIPGQSNDIEVKWDSDHSTGKVECTFNYPNRDPIDKSVTYVLKTLFGLTPSSISGVSTSETIGVKTLNLTASRLEYLRGSSDPQRYWVEDYQWLIPAGWTCNGQTSNGTTPFDDDHQITVTTNESGGGEIKVWGKSECDDEMLSNPKTVTVARNIPSFNVVISGNNTYIDGDQSTITATVPSYQTTTYQWSVSSGWSYTGSGNSISVSPNGCDGYITCTISITDDSEQTINNVDFSVFDELDPPIVTGDNVLCSTNETYICTNMPAGSSVTWSKSSNISGGSAGTPTSFSQNGSSSGSGWIQATITSTCSSSQSLPQKTVWVGEPDPDDFYIEVLDIYGNSVDDGNGIFEICENEDYSFYLYPLYDLPSSHHKYGITQTNFYPDFNYTTLQSSLGYAYLSVDYFDTESSGIININSKCQNNIDFIEMEFVEGSCGSYYLMMTPNPTSSSTTISIESDSHKNIFDNNEEWELQVVSPSLNIKVNDKSNKGKSKTINTMRWKDGIYTIRVRYKSNIMTEKLVVKH
ncbi:MAG: hypothetical protein L3J11_02905 [Draconibacterium sp.]|nr:hypothetical protein [Draconibacterium sp.]